MLKNLPEVEFVELDEETEEIQMLKLYKKVSGRSLAIGDPVRLFIKFIVGYVLELKNLINETGKQNLLKYSTEANLDNLGVFWGIERIEAKPAQTILQYELSTIRDVKTIIPKGSRVSNGDLYFAIDEDLTIPAGSSEGTITATCLTEGTVGNGYLAGEINQIVDVQSYVSKVENITTTNGGSEVEDDEALRERIYEAPEGLSVAGPVGLYKRLTKNLNSLIAEVAVISPSPGVVRIIPLLDNGQLPSEEFLMEIENQLMNDENKVLTDLIEVKAPLEAEYAIEIKFWVEEDADMLKVESEVEEAIEGYELWLRTKLGRDINDSELIRRLKNIDGIKRLQLIQPQYQQLDVETIGKCTSKTLINEGREEE